MGSYTALLLCGGQSSRMKTDKAFLAAPSDSYSASTSHNTSDDDELPLFLHLLENALFPLPSLERILISARDEAQQTRIAQSITARQHSPTTHPIETLLDKEEWRNKGPATGILTAHEQYPDSTLLVLAVDFPKTSAEALQELIRGHEQAKVEAPVTCFLHPEDGNPEPVMSIWTPKALDTLRENAIKGKSGPCFTAKQIWKESNPTGKGMEEEYGLVRPSKEEWVRDTDTPEEWQNIFGSLPRPAV